MKKLNLLSIILSVIGIMSPGVSNAQWTLQTNPLGSGDTAMVGKIQFVSPTEGWISACNSGKLLHTIDSGTTWSIVSPFVSEISGNMADPAVNMSWTNQQHGWLLKTSGGTCATSFNETNSNGALLYRTINGGTSWSRYAFPATVTTITYSASDLVGTWQLHELSTSDASYNSQSRWSYGTITIDATSLGSYSVTNNDGTNDTGTGHVAISPCGTVTISEAGDFNGFMSADKKTIVISLSDGDGRSMMILQKENASTTYTTTDLQGTWQLHQVTASKSSTYQDASWTHGTITMDASGTGTGTFISAGGYNSSNNVSISIASNGIVTMSGTDMHGFMSADKKTMTLIMSEQGGYMLINLQKVIGTTYTNADLNGKWQMHALTTSSTATSLMGSTSLGAWSRGIFAASVMGSSISDLVENGTPQDQQHISFTISSTGEIISNGTDVHGYMSSDKQSIYLTMTKQANYMSGYQLMVLQRDKTTSGDIGLQVQFADNLNGWATIFNMYSGSGQAYHSTDGGATWNPIGSGMLGFFYFVDASHGWMVGSTSSVEFMNTIYCTADGGATWTQQFTQTTYNGANISFNSIIFSDLTHGWAVGRNGQVIKTTNGGGLWTWVTNTGLTNNATIKSVFFLDANTGWIGCGSNNTDGVGSRFILATKDGGASWATQATPVTNDIFSMSFWDANHGWLTSDYGQIAQFKQNSIHITAGGLSAALSSTEKNTITGLAITGTMDARDFKTLRDDMPLLSYIDLSGTTVVAYTGTEGTYNTTSTTYPANTIPQRAFYNTATKTGKTSLTSFVFPASITAIDIYAFRGCGLTSITIPSTVATIGYGNFLANNNLASVTIPSSVTRIDKWAFAYCGNLKNITIPSSVSIIGDAAFLSAGLYNLTLPNGVTTIGDGAFQSCTSLNSVTLPKSVTYIGYCAFTFENSLNKFNVASDNPNFSVCDGVLYDKTGTNLVAFPNAKTWNFDIPSGVTVIDTAAFEGAVNLNYVSIPSTVTKLSQEAFYWCTNLQSVIIPASVNNIGGYAFYNCSNLNDIHANASTPVSLAASDSVFKYVDKSYCTLFVPTGSKTLYQNAPQWNDFTNLVEENPQITYSVTVPSGTKACYIAGEMNGWNQQQMNKIDNTHYTITLSSLTSYKYKYCSGPDWGYVERDANNNDIADRTYATNDVVVKWGNLYDPAASSTNVTYQVIVPTGTNACYIRGAMTNWTLQAMSKTDDTHYSITINTKMPNVYKYYSGPNESYIEKDVSGNEINFRAHASNDVVVNWAAVYDPTITLTYNVTVPVGTYTCYIVGAMNGWTHQAMTKVDGTHYTITIPGATTSDEYKYCSGPDWKYVEKDANGNDLPGDGNRTYTANDVVANWASLYTDVFSTAATKITIYPNPVGEGFQINGLDGKAMLMLTNVSGQIVMMKEIQGSEHIEAGSLPKGIYILKITTQSGTIDKKLIKK
jgi:hypothetical protein